MKISVIIPVLNEEKIINNALASLEKVKGSRDLEIIVVDGGDKDETLKAVKSGTAVKLSSQKGLSFQMNTGAAAATGEALVFLHADTILPGNAFTQIETALGSGKYDAGAFSLEIDSDNLLLKFIAITANLRNYFTHVPYGDQAIFIRNSFFRELGGYKEVPVMQDVDLMRRIKYYGKKIIIFREKALTSARRWQKNGILYTTFKNNLIRFLYFLGVSENKLEQLYY
ncbi:MAG: hypothetical protein A3J83_08615 [Elusimicrobia bacterium RIFOXYA2_FULL_40_6]|nr:MAG: hypothetical protein A3J83_08615 [Elusimicrobia bacterium RIFOXYA2_FULL_40_6]